MLEDKPLWKQLVEQQYNRFKPRLDYMVEKYGEEFTMTEHGTVFSVEHPDWYFNVDYKEYAQCYLDNYIVFLRKDEIQQIMQELLSDLIGDCLVFIEPCWYAPASSMKDTTAEELLTAAANGESICFSVYCYTSKSSKEKDQDMDRIIQAVMEKGYGMIISFTYTTDELLKKTTEKNHQSMIQDDRLYYWDTYAEIVQTCNWTDMGWKRGAL